MVEDTYASIARLLYTYAERLDAGDLDGMAAMFAHATFHSKDGGMVLNGTDEVRAAFATSVVFHGDTPATQHVTSNLYLEDDLDEGRVVAHSAFTVLQATPTLPLQVVCAGRYVDTFHRAADGWRFSDREVDIRFFGDVSQHIAGSSAEGTST